jgi:fibro-slime domain-containing protein
VQWQSEQVHAHVCGDGKVEGAEGCDDGNTMPFDGCSEDCQIELDCSGASCTSQCGDGIVVPPEQCDDGNTIDGDGCSKNCRVEAGWICTQPSLGDKMMVPVIYRDFRFHNPSDFEAGVVGLMSPQPGAWSTPPSTRTESPSSPAWLVLTSRATSTFAEWYRDTPGVNHTTASKMALWNNGKGGYVNRYGANGEQWNVTETAYFCGIVGEERLDASGTPIPCTIEVPDADIVATDCTRLAAKGEEMLTCYENNGSYSATFLVSKVDGNPLFFPVDNDTFTPASELRAAQIPPFYDPMATWPFDLDAAGTKRLHNFSFTSEVRYWFLYDKTKTYILDFVGDDDVWVFINKKLAVDLGGVHTAVEGSVKLDATTASSLGLVDGNVYEIAVFQAERQTTESSYKLTLTGFNSASKLCAPCSGTGPCGYSAALDAGGTGGTTGSSGHHEHGLSDHLGLGRHYRGQLDDRHRRDIGGIHDSESHRHAVAQGNDSRSDKHGRR